MALQQNFNITLDLKKQIAVASQIPTFIQNDTSTLFITLMDNGKAYDFASADRYVINMKRPDGKIITGLATYDTETQKIKYNFGSTEMELAGNLEVSISLFLGESRISTRPFMVRVLKDYEEGIPSEEGFSALQQLFIEVDTVKATVEEKALYAQQQGDYAKGIRDNFGHKGTYDNTKTYLNGNVVSYGGTNYICVQDTTVGINPLNGTYWTVVAPQAVFNEQSWIATSGQKTFSITNGSYTPQKGAISVFVGGVPQSSGINFTESSETTISFSEAIPTGVTVYAKWMEGALSITKGHKTGHEVGGQDELDVTKLKNFKENVTDQFTSVTSQLAEKATKTELTTSLSPKVDKTYVDGQLLNKANQADLTVKADKSYVDTQISNIGNASPKNTYATLAELQTAFPTGTTGVYVVTADGKWYYWNGSAWTVGGTYQATGIAAGSVNGSHLANSTIGKVKLDATLQAEIPYFESNDIGKNFQLHDKNYSPAKTTESYVTYLGCIHKLVLKGFDKTKLYKLRYFSRNLTVSSTYWGYKIIISMFDGNTWVDVFTNPTGFAVTENANGLTSFSCTVGSMTVEMVVDFNRIPNNTNLFEDASGARYIIKEHCFYENTIPSINQNITSIQSQLNSGIENDGFSMIALKSGTSHKIKFRYSETKNFVVEFNELGVNQLMHIKRLYFEDNVTGLTTDFNSLTEFYTITTDWISPYKMIVRSNSISSFWGTVGGNHGTVDAGGYPTARRISSVMYVDGKEIQENVATPVKEKVILKAVHYIAGSNTIDVNTGSKRDSCEEMVTYTITPKNIEVSVALTALENIQFTDYVGIQATKPPYNDKGYFMLDTQATIFNLADGLKHDSGLYPDSQADRFVMSKDGNMLVGYLQSFGMGRQYVATGKPSFFFTGTGGEKVYGHLVQGNAVNLDTGQTLYWTGGYTFMPPMTCVGAEKAYFINVGGKRVYCIDFFNPVSNTYFIPFTEDLNKEITIIEKSASITCDNYINGKGLKISSTGYGTLKFTT
jgi:hypothetical protein